MQIGKGRSLQPKCVVLSQIEMDLQFGGVTVVNDQGIGKSRIESANCFRWKMWAHVITDSHLYTLYDPLKPDAYSGTGSAFIVDIERRRIMTNAHVVCTPFRPSYLYLHIWTHDSLLQVNPHWIHFVMRFEHFLNFNRSVSLHDGYKS